MKYNGVFVVLVLTLCHVDGKTEEYYTFGENCLVSLEHVNEDKVVYAEYYGHDVASWCDYMSFIGRDDDYVNEYKVCVTPEIYEDPDCALELKYSTSILGSDLQTYTCTNIPTTKYCGGDDDYFYITLKTNQHKNYQNAKFKLKIEAELTYNYGQTVGIIVGAVFGGIILVTFVVGLIVCLACRGKRSPGQVMNPTGNIQLQQTNFGAGAYPQTGHNQGLSNYSSNYSTQFGNTQTPQPQSGFTYNNQPPAYADAIKI